MERFKLALVVPNYRWIPANKNFYWHFIPYNLCILAAMVKDICEVEIIDAYIANMSLEDFIALLREKKPDAVGITALMDLLGPAAHMAAAQVKAVNSDTPVIMGGVYTTVNSDYVMQDNNVDYAVTGEGEYTLRQLIGFLQGKTPLPRQGIWYRQNGTIISTERATFIQDMDAIPLPAYDLIDYPRYTVHVERKSVDGPSHFPYARMMTSRGCPFNCNFCQVDMISGRKFRPRSAEKVLDEIAFLKNRYNIQSLIFDDDNILVNKKRAIAIFQGIIDRGLRMPWKAIAIAAFHLDHDLLRLMRESGCEYIDVAIESGSQRILKEVIGKPVNLDHAMEMVKTARDNGIYVATNFILGFPTETWDEIRETISFAERLGADYVKFFNALPLRHTRLWDSCVEQNVFTHDYDPMHLDWNFGPIETKDFSTLDLAILRGYEWDRVNFTAPEKRKRTATMMNISEEELLQIRRDTLSNIHKAIHHKGLVA